MNIRSPRILCVNDDETALRTRKLFLESQGYEVLATTRSQEALEIIRSTPIDLVIADHYLWYSAEAQVAVQIKQVNSSLPIVVFSGVVEPPENMRGVDAFVTKIDGPGGLLNVISNLVSLAKTA